MCRPSETTLGQLAVVSGDGHFEAVGECRCHRRTALRTALLLLAQRGLFQRYDLGARGKRIDRVVKPLRGSPLEAMKTSFLDSGPGPPEAPRLETAAPGPQKSPTGPRNSLVFEVGVGDRLAYPQGVQNKTLRFAYTKKPSRRQARLLIRANCFQNGLQTDART